MKSILILVAISSSILFLESVSDQSALDNYANQEVPDYINSDYRRARNQINDTIATLGRVLFYDKQLSIDNTISCASCHQQAFAFGDKRDVSLGFGQVPTVRHSMRLVNVRFGRASRFFWNERANSLETQTTQPIRDHIEMGFSGKEGAPDFNDLIQKLVELEYYPGLFAAAFKDDIISERRIQMALAQFIRSIQSFDSRYDEGRIQVNSDEVDFPNFTDQENEGKRLFVMPKHLDGADCQNCHRAPVFDIDPESSNNGVLGVVGNPTAVDFTNTRSPSLRDMVNPQGELNGPLMHDGSLTSLEAVIDHYNEIPLDLRNRTKLDSRLMHNGSGQELGLSIADKEALVAFLCTLTGSAIYTDERWSDPFDVDGELSL